MASHDHEIVNEFHKRVIELDAGRLVRDEADGDYGTTTSAIPVVRIGEASGGTERTGGSADAGRDMGGHA